MSRLLDSTSETLEQSSLFHIFIVRFLRDHDMLEHILHLLEERDPHMGKTPLHMAAKSPSSLPLRILLLCDVKVDAKDKRGYTGRTVNDVIFICMLLWLHACAILLIPTNHYAYYCCNSCTRAPLNSRFFMLMPQQHLLTS